MKTRIQSVQCENAFCVFVHHPRYAQRRGNFEQIWRQALVKTSDSFVLDRLLCDVPDSRVGLRVHHGALCL